VVLLTQIVPVLYREPAFEAFDDFGDFVESINCEASKYCQVRGSNPLARRKDLPRAALESLALEAYRSRALTAAQLRWLLVFETWMEVDALLKEHEIFDYSAADFEQDRETLRELRMREARP
jgi:Uncharacterised protein family (UPF0175)